MLCGNPDKRNEQIYKFIQHGFNVTLIIHFSHNSLRVNGISHRVPQLENNLLENLILFTLGVFNKKSYCHSAQRIESYA